MLNRSFILSFLYVLCAFQSLAQQISPHGSFYADSIKLGEQVYYSLSVKYPRNMQVVFPDSTYNFSPFEFVGKNFTPTQSDDSFSYDSVTFILTSFELDEVQHLALPVYVVSNGDSVPVFTQADSVYLIELIRTETDTLALKENTRYWDVATEFNYPIILAGVLGVLVVVLGTYFLFGKLIQEKFKLYKLKKAHARFIQRYNKHLDDLRNNKHQNIEEILLLWKRYMEDLENRPYTKQTSKEIVISTENEPLRTSLRSIDRSIYGNFRDQELIHSFQFLSEYSEDRYNKKVQEVNHD